MRNKTTKYAVERVERPSNRRLLRHELKLFASTLSRVLCYYESNSTIVVARSSRAGADAGEDGRLRALVCNARVHWNQRDEVALENSPEGGVYTLGRYRASRR